MRLFVCGLLAEERRSRECETPTSLAAASVNGRAQS